jgi:hypothetical protein
MRRACERLTNSANSLLSGALWVCKPTDTSLWLLRTPFTYATLSTIDPHPPTHNSLSTGSDQGDWGQTDCQSVKPFRRRFLDTTTHIRTPAHTISMLHRLRAVSAVALTALLAAMINTADAAAPVRHWDATFTFDGQLDPVPTPLTIVQMDDLAIATRIHFAQVTQSLGLTSLVNVSCRPQSDCLSEPWSLFDHCYPRK